MYSSLVTTKFYSVSRNKVFLLEDKNSQLYFIRIFCLQQKGNLIDFNKSIVFLHFPFNIIRQKVLKLPCHFNLSYFWSFGSLLGMVLVWQILTGVVLRFNYVSDSSIAFISVLIITREVFFGNFLRWAHLNGASLFFLFLYCHFLRGLYHISYRLFMTWSRGVTILLLLIITAFLGYVLPWGQISLWGATVITNLFSAVPFIGTKIVVWLWGGFRVNTYTLGFFYSLHFLMPFVILVLVVFHLVFLHERGSSSKLFSHVFVAKIKFNKYYTLKDRINLLIFFVFILFFLQFPFLLGDPENFILSNPLVSPLHIKPEWYFLFAYAILRRIPNKVGGVIAFAGSILFFYLFPFLSKKKHTTINFLVASFVVCFLFLTWIGGIAVEAPYILLGQCFTVFYFFILLIIVILCKRTNLSIRLIL